MPTSGDGVRGAAVCVLVGQSHRAEPNPKDFVLGFTPEGILRLPCEKVSMTSAEF